MRRIIASLVLLIAGLSLFFNIERLDYGTENIVNIQSYVYMLGFAAVLLTIVVPFLHTSSPVPPLTIFLSCYLIAKAFVFSSNRLWIGGIYTYLLFTEISFLIILILLAYYLRSRLNMFVESIEAVMLQSGTQHIQRVDDAIEVIRTEVQRSRHYHRPMSVLLIRVEKSFKDYSFDRALKEIQENIVDRYVKVKLAQAFRKHLHLTDLVLEQNGDMLILCPEVDNEGVKGVVESVRSAAAEAGIRVHCSTASFPDEAITFESLVEEATRKLQVSNTDHAARHAPEAETLDLARQHAYHTSQEKASVKS